MHRAAAVGPRSPLVLCRNDAGWPWQPSLHLGDPSPEGSGWHGGRAPASLQRGRTVPGLAL